MAIMMELELETVKVVAWMAQEDYPGAPLEHLMCPNMSFSLFTFLSKSSRLHDMNQMEMFPKTNLRKCRKEKISIDLSLRLGISMLLIFLVF